MSSAYQTFSTRTTPQSHPIPGSSQVPNSADGYSWTVDDWTRLDRFLILGSDAPTYYATAVALTKENAESVLRCITADGQRTVTEIVAVSQAGRAPRNDPAIFALAMCASLGDIAVRRAALDALPLVCRTGTHLFTFATYVEQFRGWGRSLRRAVGAWYTEKDADALAYQLVKYRQRNGWTHRDLLRLAKPRPPRESPQDNALRWAVGKWDRTDDLPATIDAYLLAQSAPDSRRIVDLIGLYGDKLPREAIPPELIDADVWDALLRAGMPMTALVRNLASMTRCGLLAPMSNATRLVVGQLTDGDRLRSARVHPLAVLVALKTYESGRSARGIGEWQAVPAVVDALDAAFYAAFGNVEPTGKRTMLALDVSGSMGGPDIAGMPGITPRVASAAMALVTANVEPNHMITAFCDRFVELTISPRQRLDDVMRAISNLPFGGTDCALPMIASLEAGLEIDTYVEYTDSETWFGRMHPAQALVKYREKTGIPSKLVVCGMVSNGFTVASPEDPGMLDVVGFDTAAPSVIASFAA